MPPAPEGTRHRRHRRRRLPRLTGLQLLVSAVVLLGALGGIAALVVAINQPPAAPSPAEAPPLTSTPPPGGASSVAAPGTPETVRLVVPAGRVDLRVVPGDGVRVPMNLAAHYPGTSEPGGGGNSLFYAHAQPGMFLGLYSVHIGDEVRAYRADGSELVYRVRTIHRVGATDDSVLRQSPFEEVTLLTCTSYDPHTPRYIVTATPASATST